MPLKFFKRISKVFRKKGGKEDETPAKSSLPAGFVGGVVLASSREEVVGGEGRSGGQEPLSQPLELIEEGDFALSRLEKEKEQSSSVLQGVLVECRRLEFYNWENSVVQEVVENDKEENGKQSQAESLQEEARKRPNYALQKREEVLELSWDEASGKIVVVVDVEEKKEERRESEHKIMLEEVRRLEREEVAVEDVINLAEGVQEGLLEAVQNGEVDEVQAEDEEIDLIKAQEMRAGQTEAQAVQNGEVDEVQAEDEEIDLIKAQEMRAGQTEAREETIQEPVVQPEVEVVLSLAAPVDSVHWSSGQIVADEDGVDLDVVEAVEEVMETVEDENNGVWEWESRRAIGQGDEGEEEEDDEEDDEDEEERDDAEEEEEEEEGEELGGEGAGDADEEVAAVAMETGSDEEEEYERELVTALGRILVEGATWTPSLGGEESMETGEDEMESRWEPVLEGRPGCLADTPVGSWALLPLETVASSEPLSRALASREETEEALGCPANSWASSFAPSAPRPDSSTGWLTANGGSPVEDDCSDMGLRRQPRFDSRLEEIDSEALGCATRDQLGSSEDSLRALRRNPPEIQALLCLRDGKEGSQSDIQTSERSDRSLLDPRVAEELRREFEEGLGAIAEELSQLVATVGAQPPDSSDPDPFIPSPGTSPRKSVAAELTFSDSSDEDSPFYINELDEGLSQGVSNEVNVEETEKNTTSSKGPTPAEDVSKNESDIPQNSRENSSSTSAVDRVENTRVEVKEEESGAKGFDDEANSRQIELSRALGHNTASPIEGLPVIPPSHNKSHTDEGKQ